MRLVLSLVLALLALPACDTSAPPEEEEPGEEFVGLLVTYTLAFTGEASSATVRYTDEDGEEVTEAADFSRETEYVKEVVLEPGTEGAFSLFAEGFVVDGVLSATIQVTRADNEAQVFSDAQVSAQTSGSQEVSVDASVDVEPVTLQSSV